MNLNFARHLPTITAILLLFTGIAFASGSDDASAAKSREISLAVLPFANSSGNVEAVDLFVPLIESALDSNGFEVISAAETRRVLRKFRIRSAGSVNSGDAARISSELGVTHLLLGSIDFCCESTVEAGFSARLVRARDMHIVWAHSAAACGSDYESLLALGAIEKLDELARKLIEKAFFNVRPELVAADDLVNGSTGKKMWAVVPFDNLSSNNCADNIVNNVVLSELLARNIDVLEPGIVLDLFRRYNRLPQGEIDSDLLKKLHSLYGVEVVLTGAIDRFRPKRSGRNSSPVIELGCRYVDANTGYVQAAYDLRRRGLDYETILGMGSISSMGVLAGKTVDKMLNILDSRMSKRYASGRNDNDHD